MTRHQVMIPIKPKRVAEPIHLPNDDLESVMVPGVRYIVAVCDDCSTCRNEQGTAPESRQGARGDWKP